MRIEVPWRPPSFRCRRRSCRPRPSCARPDAATAHTRNKKRNELVSNNQKFETRNENMTTTYEATTYAALFAGLGFHNLLDRPRINCLESTRHTQTHRQTSDKREAQPTATQNQNILKQTDRQTDRQSSRTAPCTSPPYPW